jgi:hypothetical protein
MGSDFLGATVLDSDESDDDDTITDERRYNTEVLASQSSFSLSPTWNSSNRVSLSLSPLSKKIFQIKL